MQELIIETMTEKKQKIMHIDLGQSLQFEECVKEQT